MVSRTDELTDWTLTHLERDLSDDPVAVHTARRLVVDELRRAVGARPHLAAVVDAAVLITTELVTEAITAGSRLLSLHLEIGTDRVEVGVVDDAVPSLHRAVDPVDADGAALPVRVVPSLADAWGVRALPYRRWRWARLDVRSRTARAAS